MGFIIILYVSASGKFIFLDRWLTYIQICLLKRILKAFCSQISPPERAPYNAKGKAPLLGASSNARDKLAGPDSNSSPNARVNSDLNLVRTGSKRPFQALGVIDEEVPGWELDEELAGDLEKLMTIQVELTKKQALTKNFTRPTNVRDVLELDKWIQTLTSEDSSLKGRDSD